MANYRNRALLDLAYKLPCQLGPVLRDRGIDVCRGGAGEPCHSNFAEHGKGKSLKAHDCFFASGCRACHTWLDTGKAARSLKLEVFRVALDRTMLALWKGELIFPARDAFVSQWKPGKSKAGDIVRTTEGTLAKLGELPRILPRRY